MKKKQIAKLAVTLGLVGAVGVGGTLAALTAQSKAVTNTFAVGNGLVDANISLDEAAMKNTDSSSGKNIVDRTTNPSSDYEYEKTDDNGRVMQNEYINLQSGDDIFKDPTVHMNNLGDEGEQKFADCYVFIHVQGVDGLASKGITIDDVHNKLDSEWKKVNVDEIQPSGSTVDGYYYLAVSESDSSYRVVKNNDVDLDFEIFESLNVDDKIFNENGTSNINTAIDKIEIKACAVQATNVNAGDAYKEFPSGF